MNQLKDILAQLKDKEAESKVIPENSDPRVRAGVEAMVRNAKESVGRLRDLYKDAVMNHVVVIGVTGPGGQKFAEIAAKQKCVAVDYKLIKQKFSDRLRERNAGATFNQSAMFLLLDELNRAKLEYNMVRLPQPIINGYTDGILEQPLDVGLERLISKNYNNSLYSAVSRREIGAAALQSEFAGKSLPVVLYNYTGGVDSLFLPNPVTVTEAGDEVDEKFVRKVFSEVRRLVVGQSDQSTSTSTPEEVSNG